jgi:hypothetical protein
VSSWDYGVGAQVNEEWHDAVKAGMCHICIVYPAGPDRRPCPRCEEDRLDARLRAEVEAELEEADRELSEEDR